jgi:uncharacterized protein YecE (DUF72 family)
MAIWFGVAGWTYPDWKGIVYPPSRHTRFDELGYIAQYFDVIELNNTFYRIPDAKMVESWIKRVSHNPHFQFTAKLWQGFTHEKKEIDVSEVSQFRDAVAPLQKSKRLGALLAQFPASFRRSKEAMERVETIGKHFKEFPIVVEFRNRNWVADDVLSWLEERGIGFCNVDEPLFRSMIRPSSVVTGLTAYVRFHGRNYKNWFSKEANRDERYDYLYSEEELNQWIPRINDMERKAKKVYVIGNNHFRGQAPANILQLKSKTVQEPVEVPESMLDSFPELRKIAKRRAKGSKQPGLFDE